MLMSIRPDKRRLQEKPMPKPEPVQADKPAGIIEVAYGDKARQSCEVSLKSAIAHHPGIQSVAISDKLIPSANATLLYPDLDLGAREYKTQAYQYSPFEYSLFLDADTVVVGSLQAGFTALQDGWDVVAALDFRQTVKRIDHIPQNDIQETLKLVGTGEYPHLNTGMLFFRKCPEVEEMYQMWHEEWLKFKYRDQAALVRAIYRSRVKVWTVAWQWNTHRQEKAKHLWHNHHSVDRGWKGARL